MERTNTCITCTCILKLSCKMVCAIYRRNHISLSENEIINVFFHFFLWARFFQRAKECSPLFFKSKNPYCCTLHNLPKLAFSLRCVCEMNKTYEWSGKILAIAQYVIKYDYREKEHKEYSFVDSFYGIFI